VTSEQRVFQQRYDHANAELNGTWAQKYFIDQKNWAGADKLGPIIFGCGGEGGIDAEFFDSHYGLMNTMAEQFGGLKLMMEHRFYGDSLPFGEQSFENSPDRLGLLSMENALGDYAALISAVKREIGCFDCPVLALGGSYPGMLTAYFRYKYPSIVDMGLPASAALFMNSPMTPQYAYYDIITKAAAKIDPKCPGAVRSMFTGLAAATPEQRTKELSLCYPASTAVEGSWDDLEFWTAQLFAGLGMGNYPPVSSPFKAACARITSGTMTGLAPLARLLDVKEGACFNFTSYNPSLSVSGNTSFW
jgi:hypothetical protein